MTNTGSPLEIAFDVPVTRRRSIHQVSQGTETAIFACQTIGDLLAWMVENDHHRAMVVDDHIRYMLTFTRLPPQT